MKTGTGSAISCIKARAQPLLVAVPVPLFIRPGGGWADENGDWLRNILYQSKSTTAISCGACPPFHPVRSNLRVLNFRCHRLARWNVTFLAAACSISKPSAAKQRHHLLEDRPCDLQGPMEEIDPLQSR